MASSGILITGGGGGIGAAVVRRACSEGWFSLVAGRDRKRLEATLDDVRSRGARAAAVEIDVTSPDSIRKGCEEARRACAEAGPIAALVNCAGIAISAPIFGGDADIFERHLAVNFHGARRMIEALAPAMREKKYGRIVNVASSAGLRGYAYTAAYCASKHALIGYTRAAALELAGSGVAISAVCPHYVDSPLTDAAIERMVARTKKSAPEIRAFLAAENPGGRLISSAEVAAAVWSLIEQAENGTILELDGARVLRLEGPITSKA